MIDKRKMLWAARIGLGLLIAVVVGVAGLYVFAQSRPGRDFIADRIGRMLSDDAMVVRVTQLDGSVTSSFSVGKITLADGDGVYAVVDDIRLSWRPLALFGGTLRIEDMVIRRLAVHRLPSSEPSSEPTSLKTLMPGLNLRAGKVMVEDIALAPPVLGNAQRFAATASARLDTNLAHATLDLTLRRIDGGRDKAEIRFDYAARPARFEAAMRVEEPTGGVLARLAGLPRGERLFLDLTGDGPPDAWRGVLKLEAGTLASADTKVVVAIRNTGVGVAMEGTTKLDRLLPPHLRPLVSPLLRFRTEADFHATGGVSIKSLTAQSNRLTATGSGRYETTNRRIAGTIAVKSRGPRPLTEIQPGLSIGQGSIEARLAGTLSAPRIDLSLQTGQNSWGSVRIASMVGSLVLVPVSASSFDLKASMKADGFDSGGAVPVGLLGPTLTLSLAGTAGRDFTLARANLSVTSGPAKVELAGRLDGDGLAEGTYALGLDQIEAAARSAGLMLKGSLSAKGRFRAELPASSFHLSTDGALANLAGATANISPLLGPHVPFAGAIDWREGGPLKFSGLKLRPAIGWLGADGVVDIQTGRVTGEAQIAIPALRPLSPLVGSQLAGRATAMATLQGRITELTARGQARISDLEIEKTAVGQIGVGYTARREGAAVMASLRLGGILRAKKLDGSLDARVQGDAIDLSKINIGVGHNRITGSLGLNLTSPRVTGAVTAKLRDLKDLPGAESLGLTGAAEVRAATVAGVEQEIELTARASNIRIAGDATGGTVIERATARFRLKDPFTHATVAGEVALENAQFAGLRRGQAKIKISGNSENIDWSTTAAAEGATPTSLSSSGSIALAAARSRLSIKTLDGKIADQMISLRAPFAVTWQANELRVEPIDLSLAGGRVRVAGSMAGGAIDATGKLDDLPLRLASLIDPHFQLDGKVAGTLQVSGATGRPGLSAALTARDIRPLGAGEEEFAGLNLTLDLRQDGDGARAMMKLTGPNELNTTAVLSTRPLIGFDPFSLALGSDLALSGELKADGPLDLIDTLVGLGEDRLAGRIAARAKVAGTLGKPDIQGEARLNGGFYEGAATGTVLRNIEGRVTFTGDSARLVTLTADDSASGRLSGKGAVRFTGANTQSDGVEITLERFTAIRHPSAEIVSTGQVTLSGSFEAPRVTGRLQIDKGEIRIPDQLPEEIVELDVVEINGPTATPTNSSKPSEPSLAKSLPVSLDLALGFPRQTFVRGRGLDSEWKGNLVVSGTTRAPLIKGKLQVVRGTFAFAGKTFKLKSGSVFFSSSESVEPEIDAVAEAKLKTLLARITITGSVSKPTITISSEPQLPQEDVLAQILFGRTTGQLTAIQAAQLAQSAATLSGKGGGPGVMDKVRQALGVDVLDVDSSENGGRGASLKAGRYLTEEIFLSVTQGTQPGSQKVGVEVQVLPNVTVESDISGTADSNIGVNWKWDY